MKTGTNDISNKDLAKKLLIDKTALVFEGGGVLGIGHVGALARLQELGGLKKMEHVVGTSVGSVIATSLACGATIDYIERELFDLNLNRFRDGRNWIINFFRTLCRFGWHKGDQIEAFMGEVLKDLTGNANITFAEAYERFGIHLTVTYLSLKYKKTKYADYITSPNLELKKAVRWSSTIPLYYKPSRKFKLFGRRNKKKLDDLIVDGGVTDNYPIHVLREQMCDPSRIIGFKLYGEDELNEYRPIEEEDSDEFELPSSVKDYAFTLVDIIREQALRYHVHKDDWKLTIKTDIGTYKTTDFGITDEDKQILYKAGKDAVDNYLLEIEELLNKEEYPLPCDEDDCSDHNGEE